VEVAAASGDGRAAGTGGAAGTPKGPSGAGHVDRPLQQGQHMTGVI
jgi:hypothetical protein